MIQNVRLQGLRSHKKRSLHQVIEHFYSERNAANGHYGQTLIKAQLQSPLSNYEILQILSVSLFDKTPVKELINKPNLQYVKEPLCNQLKFF